MVESISGPLPDETRIWVDNIFENAKQANKYYKPREPLWVQIGYCIHHLDHKHPGQTGHRYLHRELSDVEENGGLQGWAARKRLSTWSSTWERWNTPEWHLPDLEEMSTHHLQASLKYMEVTAAKDEADRLVSNLDYRQRLQQWEESLVEGVDYEITHTGQKGIFKEAKRRKPSRVG